MLLNELKSIKSGRKERDQFGLLIGGVALAAGCYLAWRGGVHASLFALAAVCLVPVIMDKVFPTNTTIVLLPFQKAWMAVAVVLGFVMSRVILGLCFYGVFTTVRAINALLGKTLLDTRWKPGARDSYWIPRTPKDYDPKHSEQQF